MTRPTGALSTLKQFDNIPIGGRFYVVWRGSSRQHGPKACSKLRMIGEYECLIHTAKNGSERESIFLDNKDLDANPYNRQCNGYLFTNYFHAHAYAIRTDEYRSKANA